MNECKLNLKEIHIKCPSRTSISVLDMNTFSPGIPGGGNLGFGIDLSSSVKIRVSDDNKIFGHFPHKIIEHFVNDFRKRIHNDIYNFEIEINSHERFHCGLSSTGNVLTALALSFNRMFKNIFNFYEIRKILAENYMEGSEEGIFKGFTTGLSASIGIYGGFQLISPTLDIIFKQKIKNIAIINVCNYPLQKSAYKNPDMSELEQFEKIRQNPKLRKYDNNGINAVLKPMMEDFSKRLSNYKDKKIVLCGNFAGAAFDSILNEAEFKEILRVPHPSFNNWKKEKYQDVIEKLKRFIK
ncbi:MAG: hypothetical protein DRG78_19905 [Epsilonproteobacteria bacterium]|nr:MAG: hypothetical protein DRG78_19905 [Campylobacterota bacterium]